VSSLRGKREGKEEKGRRNNTTFLPDDVGKRKSGLSWPEREQGEIGTLVSQTKVTSGGRRKRGPEGEKKPFDGGEDKGNNHEITSSAYQGGEKKREGGSIIKKNQTPKPWGNKGRLVFSRKERGRRRAFHVAGKRTPFLEVGRVRPYLRGRSFGAEGGGRAGGRFFMKFRKGRTPPCFSKGRGKSVLKHRGRGGFDLLAQEKKTGPEEATHDNPSIG